MTARRRKAADLLQAIYEHVGCHENVVLDCAFIAIKVQTGISDATIFSMKLKKKFNEIYLNASVALKSSLVERFQRFQKDI